MYTDEDYINAIKFGLNYPLDKDMPISYSYKEDKDIYKIVVFDGGWVTFRLDGFYVRSCLKYKGIKKWN